MLSEHLASRQEVGRILRESGVPTIEFRASIVIGSGSASFEMLRALVERLPVMVTPRWVNTRTQPIAIEDVIAYLLAALDYEPDGGEVFEIGGADVCSYLDLMHEYADQRGLRRQMVPVPVLTPRLSSLWLHLVTPVYAGIGRELVDSLRNETVVNDPRALEVFPVRPRTSAEAVARALATRTTRSRRPAGRTRRRLRPGLRRRPLRLAAGRLAQRHRPASARRRVRADPADRRRHRLVRRRRPVEAARRPRHARRRTRPSARPPRPGRRPGRRHDRLLARRGLRAGPAATARRRDEAARTRLAPVRSRPRRERAARRSGRRRSSTRPASPASPTGTRSGRSTTTSSAACSRESRPPQRRPNHSAPKTLALKALEVSKGKLMHLEVAGRRSRARPRELGPLRAYFAHTSGRRTALRTPMRCSSRPREYVVVVGAWRACH